MRHARPVAPDDLDVCTACARKNCSTRARLDAVDLPGQPCLGRERAVLHWEDLKLEAIPGCKVALADHEHEAGIALRLDHHVFPRLQVRGGWGWPAHPHGRRPGTSHDY